MANKLTTPLYQRIASKKWKQNNKEHIKKYKMSYYYKNHDKIIEFRKQPFYRYKIYKDSAKRRGLIFEITKDEFLFILSQPCYYCGNNGYGIDRVDNTFGYLKDNVVSCCTMCNMMKKGYSKEKFLEQCDLIVNNNNGK